MSEAFRDPSAPRYSYFNKVYSNPSDTSSEDEDQKDEWQDDEPHMWDRFVCYPPQLKTGSKQTNKCLDITVKITKVLVYLFLFTVVLGGSIIAKSVILFATSQLRENRTTPACDRDLGAGSGEYVAKLSEEARVSWIWCIVMMFIVPEVFGIIDAIRMFLFKKRMKMPPMKNILFLMFMEGAHTLGLALLFLAVLPELDVIKGAALTSCICFIPGVFALFTQSRPQNAKAITLLFVFLGDLLAVTAQVIGIFVWPILDLQNDVGVSWMLPFALVLSSCRWWSNYVSPQSWIGTFRWMAKVKKSLAPNRHILKGVVAILRIIVFIICTIGLASWKGIEPHVLFKGLSTFEYNIIMIDVTNIKVMDAQTIDSLINEETAFLHTDNFFTPLSVFLIQAFAALFVYESGKFAYKTFMHVTGFAIPISISVPSTLILLLTICGLRQQNTCAFHGFIPDHLFFDAPVFTSTADFMSQWYIWLWLTWILSYSWITSHIWAPELKILTPTDHIFNVSTYDTLIVDQAVCLNKQKYYDEDLEDDDDNHIELENHISKEPSSKIQTESNFLGTYLRDPESIIGNIKMQSSAIRNSDRVSKIYACATMWHETREEMNELIGSILRLDSDQCAMRVTQNYYKIALPDYYELETHIFFDDAFCCMHGCKTVCCHDENEVQANEYVMTFIEMVKENITALNVIASAPKKYPTPYGGRLVWILPGKSRMVVHLKDKNKIRHRKRWSQVMYMYYLLGYGLMSLQISMDRKDVIAENTYILTLDGDIDFKPSAVKVLLHLMRRDRDLGAACGRIHPVGSGPMVWFQKFEYAIGHWLQKSTEHMVGCVLCSPGCFSLFRAKALMQPNVMAKYATKSTEPRHYVQYDQGEDRWLCTLILQMGCKVEYSAASDAYTHAPEGFNEFYSQRRRWIPSTIANIMDLLSTAKETRKVNNDISLPYIGYQWILMGSTILGPGTIFLMLVGAFVAAFKISNWTSFSYNLIPIAIFVGVCCFCKQKTQLLTAAIITAIYGLVMVVVLVGIMLQIAEDGWVAPSTILFFVVGGQLILAGLLHPQEWSCLLCGIIYYITVPSMYMILIIFSIFNLNNVTWGTRETTASQPQQPADTKTQQSSNKVSRLEEISNKFKRKGSEKGSFEFSFAGLFKCILCTQDTPTEEEVQLLHMSESLRRIDEHLEQIEKNKIEASVQSQKGDNYTRHNNVFGNENNPETKNMINIISSDEIGDSSNTDSDDESRHAGSQRSSHLRDSFAINPWQWLQDERLREGEVHFISGEEEEFWKDLLEKYLLPIDDDKKQQEKTAEELRSLRDGYIVKFFMLNALFVLIIFLMQLQKDSLHMEWPLGKSYNITYDKTRTEVNLTKFYLKLEPIGCVFILGFVAVLLLQFLAMLFHRFDTFAHVLANTSLDCCKSRSSLNTEEVLAKEAQDIVGGLQYIPVVGKSESFNNNENHTNPTRRKTLRELKENTNKRPRAFTNFEKMFRDRLKDPEKTGFMKLISRRMSKDKLAAFEKRRSTVVAARRRTNTRATNAEGIYDRTYAPRNNQSATNHRQDHQVYNNHAFQPDDPIYKEP